MDVFHLRIFQQQVLDQCHYLIFAANDVDNALKARDIRRTFYAIQCVLNAGANISKILWGQGGRADEQRKPIRESLRIEDNSPLRNVTMRNHFEHIDERIDRWWETSKNHNHFDKFIGPKNNMIVGANEKDVFRLYDPQTTEIIFWGQAFNLQALVDEVQRILPKLQEEVAKPHWD